MTVNEIFIAMNSKIQANAARYISEVGGIFKFSLSADGDWYVNCKDTVGVTRSVQAADCSLTMDSNMFIAIHDGTLGTSTGQIIIGDGSDLGMLLKWQILFE